MKIFKFNILSNLFIIALSVFACTFVYSNQLRTIESLDLISDISLDNVKFQAVVPYSIFSSVKYTSRLDRFCFDNHEIKINKIENPYRILVEISKLDSHHVQADNPARQNNFTIEYSLPWWSKSAPSELKRINFSNIDGSRDSYDFGNGYHLSLLQKQGNWGKVYLLEHLSGERRKKICAVKLILTRSDRKMSVAEFHKRHHAEIENNIKIASLGIAAKPYGIIKNDDDHYLLFMEYGHSAHDHFKKLSTREIVEEIQSLFKDVARMHDFGYAHGDLKIDNMLIVGNKIKLCDWLSLNEYNKTIVGEFRYIGDNLPPEAIRANYLKEDRAIQYAVISSNEPHKAYFLHPISSDRFCLAVSVLEVLEPDLYKKITYVPKDFNPWAPQSLDFYPQYVSLIKETQAILLERAVSYNDPKRSNLYKQITQFIDVDPMKRIMD